MPDRLERYDLDTTGLGAALEALPGSYDGPTRRLEPPYGVVGFGEGAWPAEVARGWIEAALVSGGTQFILQGGLDFGEAEATAVLAETQGAPLVRLGPPSIRADEDEVGVEVIVPFSPLSAYAYLQALAHATGRASSAAAADAALAELRDRCRTSVPTDENPAKRLAWSLWTRTPILIASAEHSLQPWAWSEHLGRVGKSMSVPLERNPLAVLSGGFEARHESGDNLVALVLGPEDEATRLAREVLETRLDEVIAVEAPGGEPYAAGLGLWYLGAWVGYYLALLYGVDPRDTPVLEKLRRL